MAASSEIQEQKSFYDEYWRQVSPVGAYKVQRSKWIMGILTRLRKQIANSEPVVLDMGCGDGRLTPIWHELTCGTTYGIDLSPEAIKRAAERYPFINYSEQDATATSYNDSMFDIIICQEVIEHIEQQERLVSEISRILKPGGYLVLTTPNKFYFDRRKGGNYSKQPIENLVDKKQLLQLFPNTFSILSFETLIYAGGDFGIYKYYTNRLLLGTLNRLGLKDAWKRYLLKKGYGLHMAAVFQKC